MELCCVLLVAFDDAEIIAAAAVACRVIARYVNDSAGGQQINITVGRQRKPSIGGARSRRNDNRAVGLSWPFVIGLSPSMAYKN